MDTTGKLSETIPEIEAQLLNEGWTYQGEEELIAAEPTPEEKPAESKIYYSLYDWLFSTNSSPSAEAKGKLNLIKPGGGALCVEMGFTWTFPRNQDATHTT